MNTYNSCMSLVGLLLVLGASGLTSGVEVRVDVPGLGRIQGLPQKTARGNRDFAAFTGIPYGKVVKRFALAEPVDQLTSGDDVFDATRPQKGCVQIASALQLGNFTEDCLSLNVFTPQVKTSERQKLLPVIVFIHGGAFIRWSGNLYNGNRLLERDVVLVSINYRLNIFGFFCLENDNAPGNLGLYDQVLSLKWVNKYIESFGGDPNKVTIAGQSAGGASVTYLMDSPLTTGLIHGAISASGNDLSGWAKDAAPLKNSLAAASLFGCANLSDPASINLELVLECMQSIPAESLLNAQSVFFSAPAVQSFPLLSTPKVTPNSPYVAQTTVGLEQKVPLLIGTCKNDGSFLTSRVYTAYKPSGLLESHEYLRDSFLTSLLTSSTIGLPSMPVGILDTVISQYLGSARTSGNFTKMTPGIIDIFSTFYFKAGAYATAKAHSSIAKSNVYLYSFDYYGVQTFYPYTGGVAQVPRGVAHVDDMMYLFYYAPFTNSQDQAMSNFMVDTYVNFATFGNPNRRYATIPPLISPFPLFSLESQRFAKINKFTTTGTQYTEDWVGASKNIY